MAKALGLDDAVESAGFQSRLELIFVPVGVLNKLLADKAVCLLERIGDLNRFAAVVLVTLFKNIDDAFWKAQADNGLLRAKLLETGVITSPNSISVH